jgi:hypothetical protein
MAEERSQEPGKPRGELADARVFGHSVRWGEDLGADCGRYHPCRNRAGFEPCVHFASPSVSSVLVDSKRGEVGRRRRGSNPARQNLEEKTTAVRAAILAPPRAVFENTCIGQLIPWSS